MAQADLTADITRRASEPQGPPPQQAKKTSWTRMVLLILGAVLFLFPFYYMFIASLQAVTCQHDDVTCRTSNPGKHKPESIGGRE